MKKNYKIRKDLSITVNGHTLFRIEAMDGLKAIHFWKKWKPILQAICGENK